MTDEVISSLASLAYVSPQWSATTNKAIAEIERLRGATSETVKWVSVKERLPEDGVRVLGFWPTSEDEPMSASSYGITVRWNGSWYNADDDDDLYGDASHWMPLPEAPK